ncbi:hypothetical protein CPB84DRAFT_1223886 [Gymnopilus junonius]|uniref:Uncharacterized protein n=1 Tax=Gymnopilus junonius TaxID=109634 RepID=A0A9P5NY25_GYMJU|nr:hypothetical protein CPB84DRAFT_1223886 [Gymnopilus junonius]
MNFAVLPNKYVARCVSSYARLENYLRHLKPDSEASNNTRAELAILNNTPQSPVIRTLDPQKLRSKDRKVYDLSDKLYVGLRTSPVGSKVNLYYHNHKASDEWPRRFPFNTVGALYFHPPPPDTPLSAWLRTAGIRFRIMRHLVRFDDGEDLKLPNGDVWQIPLSKLVTVAHFKPLLEKLEREKLVQKEVLADVLKGETPLEPSVSANSPLPLVYSLNPRRIHSSGQEIFNLSWKLTSRIHVVPDNSSHRATIPLDNSISPGNSILPDNSIPRDAPTPPESTACSIYYHNFLKLDDKRFPPDTVGVLYYYQPSPDKVLEGGIRFRLMSDVSKFDDGEDLKLPNGNAWHIPLPNLATRVGWKPFLEKLKRENLVDEDVVTGLIKNYQPIVHTLDPRKLQSSGQEVFDLSGTLHNAVRVLPDNSTPPCDSICPIFYHKSTKTDNQKFPPGTVGALYYHLPPSHNVVAGGIRFRLMADVSQFDSGEDLKLPTGGVWQIPLHRLSTVGHWGPLLSVVRRESLVDEAVITDLQKLQDKPARAQFNYHYELGQPFVLDLEGATIARGFVNRSMTHSFRWNAIGAMKKSLRLKTKVSQPYTGRLLVRLELSTVSSPYQCYVPPEYDLLVDPVPSELLQRRLLTTRTLEPFFYSLQSRKDGAIVAAFAGIPLS